DVDDGLAAGLITLAELNRVELWRRILDGRQDLSDDHTRYHGVRALINTQVQDLVQTVARRVLDSGLSSADAVRAAPGPIAGLSDREALNEHARLFDPFVSP